MRATEFIIKKINNEDISRRNFIRGVGAAAGLGSSGVASKTLRDYEPKEIPNLPNYINAPDTFIPDSQQLLHDKFLFNRLTKDIFLNLKSKPDFDSAVEFEQVFSKPLNSNVTLIFDNYSDKGYWVTPAIFDTISKEIAAEKMLVKKNKGIDRITKNPLATDKLPNTMRQSEPPDPTEHDRLYRGIGANIKTEMKIK